MVELKNIEFYKNPDDNWKEELINGRLKLIPKDSIKSKLSELVLIKNNLRKPISSKNRINGEYPYYGATGIQGKIDTYSLEGKFLLIGEDGADWSNTGKDTSYIVDGKFNVNNHAHVLKLNNEKEIIYLKNFINYQNLMNIISGSVILKLTNKNLQNIDILNFKNKENEKIASILETQENLIDSKKELLEKYKKQRKYFQQELLSGRIRMKLNNKSMSEAFELGLIKQTFLNDANEVVEYGGDTITNVNIDIIDKDGFESWLSLDFENKIEFYKNIDFKEEKINGRKIFIPMNWKIDTLNNISNFRRGAFPQPYGLEQWYDDINGKPFIQVCDIQNDKIKNITKKRISLKAEPFSLKVLPGTIVLTIQGTIGKIAIIEKESFVDRTLLIFQNINENINKKYFFKNIKALFEIEEKKAEGGVIKSINKEKLSKFIVKLPNNLIEQSLIAEQLTKIDNLIESLEEEIRR